LGGCARYVTVGNYPGLEARAYGSEGALICRLVEQFGVCQTLHKATPEAVEFITVEITEQLFPPGAYSRRNLTLSVLLQPRPQLQPRDHLLRR
jgi:hypothetical protein